MGLPSGQAVAAVLGVSPLDADVLQLAAAPAPLWYDVLAEAATVGEGRILGPVGGGIVGEVILELLAADPASFVNAKQPWAPFLGNRPNECTLTDLVAYATGMNGFRWERPRVLPMQRVRRE